MTSSKYALTIESDNLKDFIAKVQWAAMDTRGYEAGITADSAGKGDTKVTALKEEPEKDVDDFSIEEDDKITQSQIELKLKELNHVCGRDYVTKITKTCKVNVIRDIPVKYFQQVIKQCDNWIAEKKGEIEAAALKQSAAETESDVTDSLFDLDDDEEIEVGGEEGTPADVELEVLKAVAKVANEDYKKGFKESLEPYGIKGPRGLASLPQASKNTLFAALNNLIGK